MTAVLYAHTRPGAPIAPEILRRCVNAARAADAILRPGTKVRFLRGGRETSGIVLYGADWRGRERYAVSITSGPDGGTISLQDRAGLVLEEICA
jgi:hypothetical protein